MQAKLTLLRSHFGCKKCRERKKKCDEQKPVCGACARLKLQCHWSTPSRPSELDHQTTGEQTTQSMVVRRTSTMTPPQTLPADSYLQAYDDPSILRGSATSIIRNAEDKHSLQYLCEAGTALLRYPNQLAPGYANLNTFRLGFQMAAHFPVHVQALVALGAGHLSRLHDGYRQVALISYGQSMNGLLSQVQRSNGGELPEWTCAVAALLAVYQLVMLDSTAERQSHLLGFFRLVEDRIRRELPWGPLQVLFEHYIHSFTINVLFQFHDVIGDKSMSYTTELIRQLDLGPRPLGKEIAGVPQLLTIAAYKLSFLNYQQVDQNPWSFELSVVSKSVRRWDHASHALKQSAEGLFMVGQLYRNACLCLAEYLEAKSVRQPATSSNIEQFVEAAASAVEGSTLCQRPFNVVSWPLTVLGIFAQTARHRSILIQPLKILSEDVKVLSYSTATKFLHTVWDSGVGPEALDDVDLLKMVHI